MLKRILRDALGKIPSVRRLSIERTELQAQNEALSRQAALLRDTCERYRALVGDLEPAPESEGPLLAKQGLPRQLPRFQYKEIWNHRSTTEHAAKLAVSGFTDESAYRESAEKTRDMLRELVGIRAEDVVLEIGAGVGRVGAVIAPLCREWIGVDVSENMVAHMRRRLGHLPNARCVSVSGYDLSPIPSESVDLVYSTVVFMHLEEWERFGYIAEAFRVLRLGGRLLVDNINLLTDEGWAFFESHHRLPPGDRLPHVSKASTPQELEAYFKRAGFEAVQQRHAGLWIITHGRKGLGRRDYENWIRLYDRPAILAPKAQPAAAPQPLISVVMPVYDPQPELLAAAIRSVQDQSYGRWELCIADDASTSVEVRDLLRHAAAGDRRIRLTRLERNSGIAAASNAALGLATGDYVAFLDHDDLLAVDALTVMAAEIAAHPEAALIYSDEDKIDGGGRRFDPYFKPDWNPDLFYSQNYLNHLSVYRRAEITAVGGLRPGFDGSQDYDLALRIIERVAPAQIRHVPRILYHWRATEGSAALSVAAKPYARIRAREAVQAHFQRAGVDAVVETDLRIFQRVRWPLPKERPLVSLIIPTRDSLDMLRRCVESIRRGTDYAPWEMIIVDNASEKSETLDYLAGLAADPRIRVLRDERPFNYAALNNRAATLARGTVLGFLNNDLAVIEGDWLGEMVSHVVRPGVGAVGARLLYEDGTVQHAGVVLGLGGIAGHWHRLSSAEDPGYFGRALLAQEMSAVTAACMLVPKSVFERVGGFDADNLAIAFNDIDLCLRIRAAGYRIVWTPYATLYHRESASRGLEDTREKQLRFARECEVMRTRWGEALQSDPFFNPNLSLELDMPGLAFPPRQPTMRQSKAS